MVKLVLKNEIKRTLQSVTKQANIYLNEFQITINPRIRRTGNNHRKAVSVKTNAKIVSYSFRQMAS